MVSPAFMNCLTFTSRTFLNSALMPDALAKKSSNRRPHHGVPADGGDAVASGAGSKGLLQMWLLRQTGSAPVHVEPSSSKVCLKLGGASFGQHVGSMVWKRQLASRLMSSLNS